MTGRGALSAADDEMLTLKLDGDDGQVVWSDYHGGSAGYDDVAWDVVVGPDGHPVVTGFVMETDNNPYCLTRKLDSADGDPIWSRLVAGAYNDNQLKSSWLAVMDDGDVVMCQRAWGNSYDTLLERYAATDGATVWSTLYDGATHLSDEPKAMVRDAAGDLLVAGIQSVNYNYNYLVLKFDGSDGSLVWEADGYDGPGGGWWDQAASVRESPTGDVVVTGLSDGSSTGTGWDITTVAYDPDLGTELWAHRWDGPAGTSDEGREVAISSSGEIFVTGYGYGMDTGKDLVTLRLEAPDSSPVPGHAPIATVLQAWPNPFNPRVNLSFSLAAEADVRLRIFDLRGREITVLKDERLGRGDHQVAWDGRGSDGRAAASGVYLAIVETDNGRIHRKIVLQK